MKKNSTPFFLLLKILIVCVFVQYFLRFDLGLPNRITLIDDLLFYCLLGFIILQRMAYFKLPYYLVLPLFFIVVLGFLSGRINNSPLYVTILGLRGYLQYLFLFLLIINLNITKEDLINLSAFFVDIFLFLQIPLISFQLIQSILKTGSWNPDSSFGSFGASGANVLSYATMFPLFLVVGNILEERMFDAKNKWRLFFLLFIIIFTQGRLAIILAPLVFVFVYRGQLLSNKIIRKWGFRLLVSCVAFFLVFNIFNTGHFKTSYNLFDHFTKYEFNVDMGANRYLWLFLLWQYVSKSWSYLLIGYGPGEFWSYISTTLNRPLVVETYNYWNQTSYGVDTSCATGLVPAIGEFGFIGFFLFFWIFYKNYRFGINLFKHSDNPLLRAYCLPVIAGSIMMLVGVYIHAIWEHQNIAFFYWFFVGVLYKLNMLYTEEQKTQSFEDI